MSRFALLSLPPETLIDIARQLPTARDIGAFCQTNSYFYSLLTLDLYRRDDKNWALAWAAWQNSPNTAKHALVAGANINGLCDSEDGVRHDLSCHEPEGVSIRFVAYLQTPLCIAARCNNAEIVRILLNHNAKEMHDNQFKRTPLHWAAIFGCVNAMAELLKEPRCVALLNLLDFSASSALEFAAVNGHRLVVAQLLACKTINPNPDPADLNDNVLINAALKGHSNITSQLLAKEHGFTQEQIIATLVVACGKLGEPGTAIAEALVERVVRVDGLNAALDAACDAGRTEVVKILLSNGADPGSNLRMAWRGEGTANMPALHTVAWRGFMDIAKLLLRYGANPDHADKEDISPLHHACHGGQLEMVKLLIETGGVWIDRPIRSGHTCLHMSLDLRTSEVYDYLLQSGADVGAADVDGESVLHHACARGSVDVVRQLLERNADPNFERIDKRTPLYTVCKFGCFLSLQDLLRCVAGLRESNNNKSEDNVDCPPPDRYLEIASLLLTYGAKPELPVCFPFTTL